MVIGLEVHCELATATKLFCACANHFGDEPNTNICPVCLGLPGSLPVLNGAAVELAMRLGLALQCDVKPSRVRPEELLLPGHAEGLPDLPVRPADQRGRPARAAAGSRRHQAGPHRGGHRQVHPRRRRRPHPRRRPQPRRLQPRRRAAARDRRRSPTSARASRPRSTSPSCARSSSPPGERRQDGGGLDAGRRQRVGPPRRRAARHPLRDQEPQLAALARPGHRVRGAPPDRPARGAASGCARRPATGTRRGPHRHAARRRRRPTTTATSPSPTSCRSSRPPTTSPRIDASLPPLPGGPPRRAGRAAGREPTDDAVALASSAASTTWPLAAIDAGADAARVLTHVEHNLAVDGAARLRAEHLAAL